MIYNRDQIRSRDRLHNSITLDVPEIAPDAQVRLCPMPASVQMRIGAMDQDKDALGTFCLVVAGCLCDEAGQRLYTTSDEDLDAIQEDFTFGALAKIAEAALKASGMGEGSAEGMEKNS